MRLSPKAGQPCRKDAKANQAKRVLILLAIAVVPYINTFQNEFVGYDDQNLIQSDETIQDVSVENIIEIFTPRLRGNYQPIRTLSYAVDYALWGLNPFGFHLTNLLFHAAAVVGVWLLLRHVMSEETAFLSAIVFAVLPIHVENIAWMSSRKDVLSLAFFLLSILAYEESSARKNAALYAVSLLAAALALLSKLTAVTLPMCILLLEVCRDGRPDLGAAARKIIRLFPHFALVAIVIGLNFLQMQPLVQHGDALAALEEVGRPAGRHVWLSMPLVVWRYIGLTVLPFHLNTHYEVARITGAADARFWIPLLSLFGALAVAVVAFLRGKRVVAFCIAWFFITFLPTSNIIPTAALLVDRYMHIPSIGIAALLALVSLYPLKAGVHRESPSFRRLAAIPAIALILLFSLLTLRRNTDWRDTVSLFSRTLAVNPRSVNARLALGAVLEREGRYDSAIEMYREALEIAPANYRVLYNLGLVYLKKGWTDHAIRTLEEAKAANPGFTASRFNLALAYHQQGHSSDAIAEHLAILQFEPHFALSHGALGRIYLERGELDLAIDHLNLALRDQTDLVPALMDRAEVLLRQGRYDLADDDAQKLSSLGIDTTELRARLQARRAAGASG